MLLVPRIQHVGAPPAAQRESRRSHGGAHGGAHGNSRGGGASSEGMSVTLDCETVMGMPRDSPVGRLELCVTGAMSARELGSTRFKYGILFIFGLFHEYSNLEYVHIHGIYKVNQAENVVHILVVAPQEYVNIYSTRRLTTHSSLRLVSDYHAAPIVPCLLPHASSRLVSGFLKMMILSLGTPPPSP